MRFQISRGRELAWQLAVPLIVFLSSSTTAVAVQVASSAPAFRVGVVTSASGHLRDVWHEGVAGYEVWIQKVQQTFPTGFPITDGAGNTFRFSFTLEVQDDESDLDKHMAAVENLIENNGTDFIMNVQPAFAVQESIVVNEKRINLHGATSNDEVFARDLPNVFGISQSNTRFFPDIFKQFNAQGVRRIAIIFRDDVSELRAACQAAVRAAGDELLPIAISIPYTSSSIADIEGVAKQLNSSNAEALVACSMSDDAHQLIDHIHQMRKPLKSIVFTNGPASLEFLAKVGDLSEDVITPVSWHPNLQYRDSFFGAAKDYGLLYSSSKGSSPTHIAAGASAAGYLLMLALQGAFRACDILASAGDPQALLWGNTITCSDNQNNALKRLRDVMSQTTTETFFGPILFSSFRQNFAGGVTHLQVFPQIRDLRRVLVPSVVLPLRDATSSLVLPQPNRYNPVCKQGSFQNPDEFEPCILCDRGLFQDTEGASRCQLCFKDFYSDSTGSAECSACPANSETAVRGATDITQCTCKVGFYTQIGLTGTACLPCPDHATCAGGVDPPRNNPGWHAEKDKPFKMYDCNPGTPCTGNYTCSTGYTGRMCQDCDAGYFDAFGRCIKCITPVGNIVVMLLIYVLFIIVVVGLSRHLDVIHLLMNFGQTLSVLALFNLRWPPALETIFNIARILSFEMDLVQPQCIAPEWGFAENLYIQLAWPVFLLVFMLAWTGITQAAFRLKLKVQGKSLDQFSSASFSDSLSSASSFNSAKMGSLGSAQYASLETSSWWILLQNLVYIPSSPQEMNELWLERMGIPLMALNLAYVVMLEYTLAAFSCMDFMGTKYMYFSLEDVCYTSKHYKLMMIAAAGLVVYIGGTWMMLGHVMYTLKVTGSFGAKRPLLLFGWLYERYESKYFWFEVHVLAEKTAFVAVAAFIPEDPVLQVLIMFLVSFASVLISIQTLAPIDKMSAWMLTGADGAILFLMSLGLVFYNDEVQERTRSFALILALIVVVGMLAILTFGVLVEAAFHIIIFVLRSRHKTVASKWGQDARKYKYMYLVFKPLFLFRWLYRADIQDWQSWHRLCNMLHDHAHPTCETSYLSQKKVGHFWSYLLSSFPEMLDFLASVEESERNEFVNVIEVMYEHYFDTTSSFKCQLNDVITSRFRAPIAQWLSSATEGEAAFLRKVITSAFSKAAGKEGEEEITRAFSRSSKSHMGKPTNENVFAKGSKSLETEDSLLRGVSSDCEADLLYLQGLMPSARGGKNFADLIRAHSKNAVSPVAGNSPPSSKAQVPSLPLQAALKYPQRSSAGLGASPFATIQGVEDTPRPTLTGRRCKFDLGTSGVPVCQVEQQQQPQQQEQQQQQSTDPGTSVSLPIKPPVSLSASTVATARDVVLSTDELLHLQNSPRPKPPSLSGLRPATSQQTSFKRLYSQSIAGSSLPQHGSFSSLTLARGPSQRPSSPGSLSHDLLKGQLVIGDGPKERVIEILPEAPPGVQLPGTLPEAGPLFAPRPQSEMGSRTPARQSGPGVASSDQAVMPPSSSQGLGAGDSASAVEGPNKSAGAIDAPTGEGATGASDNQVHPFVKVAPEGAAAAATSADGAPQEPDGDELGALCSMSSVSAGTEDGEQL